MNIYQDNGYVDIKKILTLGLPFNFVVGGRGTGKTYDTLKSVIEHEKIFMYMRRTQSQVDLINKPEFSPFKSLNNDRNWNIGSQSISKYNAGFYHSEDGVCIGNALGYTCALSTISNMRGFDASDVAILIYDEFVPEKHERPLKNEGMAFLNAYETINRNRELKGIKPLQVICLANANDLANEIFIELFLVKKAEQMRRKGQEISIDRDRGIGLFLLNNSPISCMKKTTALYRITNKSNFSKMSLDNDFAFDDTDKVKSKPLCEYKSIVSIGEITIYEHKSNGSYYISTHKSGACPSYSMNDIGIKRFRMSYNWIWWEYLENNVTFEEYLCEILLTKCFN